MNKPTELNPLEIFQQKANGMIFTKQYYILNSLSSINPIQKQLIELILSYQFDDKQFYMKYEDIGNILKIGVQTVTNYISQLKKLGYIHSNNKSNYDGVAGGSSSTLYVDYEKIIEDIKLQNFLDLLYIIEFAIEETDDDDKRQKLETLYDKLNPILE